MSVFVCSKVNSLTSKDYVKVDVPDLSLQMRVETLYSLVASKLNLDPKSISIVAYGKVLQPCKTLANYGVRSSSILFVYKKPEGSNTDEEPKLASVDQGKAHTIVVALRTALVNPDFRNVIDRLNEREHRENLMSVTPGLREDPIAMAILQDIELLDLCTQHENIIHVLERHPSLGTAATFLAAQFHEEHASADIFRRSPRQSYSLDDMPSDDDEPEPASSESSTTTSRSSVPRNPDGTPDYARLLREALATARQAIDTARRDGAGTSGVSSTPRTNQPSQPTQRVQPRPTTTSPRVSGSMATITPEMLQQALASVESQVGNTPAPVAPQPPTTQPPLSQPPRPPAPAPLAVRASRDWSRELAQMREMGITDEDLCIQTLEITNGNVEQAINIIFNQ